MDADAEPATELVKADDVTETVWTAPLVEPKAVPV